MSITAAYFVGTWSLFIGPTPHHEVIDGKGYLVVGSGAHVPPLEVRSDGTYTWTLDSRTVIRGRWRDLQASERSESMNESGIVLLDGEDHRDWAMWRPDRVGTATNQDVMAMKRTDLGTSYQGTRIR